MKEITSWLYLSDLNHLTVREWVNGLWFAVSFVMVLELGGRLRYQIKKYGLWGWRSDIGTRAVASLFGYFFGETLMRGWIWLLLALQNSDSPYLNKVQADFYIAILAATISTWAALCCLYVFSRNHWAWIRASVVIIIFVSIEMLVF